MSSRIVPFGDSALLAELGGSVEPAVNADVHALARAVELERATGAPWGRPVAAYASVLVPFDPLVVDTAEAIERLRAMVEGVSREPTDTRHMQGDAVAPIVIDVRYGGEGGPDLAEVARITGLSEADVVTTHAAGTYRVYFLGFAPGFGYLGPLPTALAVPRRATPRTRVPAGTVAIAGLQTAVYPLTTPGGWQLIGRTELPLWDAHRDPPALLRQGQPVRFRALPAG